MGHSYLRYIRHELLGDLFAKFILGCTIISTILFTLAIWSTYARTEKFNNGGCVPIFATAWTEKFTQYFTPNKLQVWMGLNKAP